MNWNCERLTLGELRSATSGFETVFLTFLNASVTGQHSSLLEGGTIFVGFEQRTGDAKTDRFGLSSEAAAFGAALQALAVMEKRSVADVVEEHLEYDEEKKAIPNASNHEKYLEAYSKWKKYCDAAAPIFK